MHCALRITLILVLALPLAAEMPKIIFDTDMTGDCDDCGALAVLHALADQGEAEILGCIASYGGNPYVAGCIDAINTYYGRGDLPLGAEQSAYGRTESHYLEAIATDSARYGHDVITKADVPPAVSVYRQLLAEQPDRAVTIVTVGRLKSLYDLLASPADNISDLDGMTLVKQKAVRWVCMGGHYPNAEHKSEANFCTHGGAAYTAKTVALWPLPVVFSGHEIGNAIHTGTELIKQNDDNPVARAYRLYFAGIKQNSRQSWDQTAVLFAVRGADPYWDMVVQGVNVIGDDGINIWQETPDSEHAYLVQQEQPEAVAEAIEQLMTRPPGKK